MQYRGLLLNLLLKLKDLNSSCPGPAILLANSVITVNLKFVFACDVCPEKFVFVSIGVWLELWTLQSIYRPFINLHEAWFQHIGFFCCLHSECGSITRLLRLKNKAINVSWGSEYGVSWLLLVDEYVDRDVKLPYWIWISTSGACDNVFFYENNGANGTNNSNSYFLIF
jgi:hypothetical protein